jgi:hypothetical protein
MSFAFIVDGQTEKKIVQRLCPDMPIRMTNLNGRDVSIPAIAKRVSSLVKLLKDRYYPVLVLVDREAREQSSEEIEAALLRELVQEYGIQTDNVVVSCPDRMIENWMLSDPASLQALCDVNCPEHSEGSPGKSLIKRLLAEKGIVYHQLTIGVEVFTRINVSIARRNSASFNRMAEYIDHSCRWLRVNA